MSEKSNVTRLTEVPTVRRKKQVIRLYNGSSTGPLFADFKSSSLSADAELMTALPRLRQRARYLERNDPFIRRYFQLMQDNVVGHQGIRLKMRARNLDSTLDEGGNKIVEAAWRKFSMAVTADGLMDMIETLNTAELVFKRDGECFVQILTGAKYEHMMALKFIEADLVDETYHRKKQEGRNQVRMGVELDDDERPVAYYVLDQHPGDGHLATSYGLKRKHTRVPADRMIHIYEKRRPGQTRGEPPLAPVMRDMKLFNGMQEAEIVHRRVSAAKMGFFTQDADAGPAAAIADAEEEDEFIVDADAGSFKVLPKGYSFDSFDANSSQTDYAAFSKQILRSISAGLGPSYADLGMDLTDVSYSSIRQGALSDRDLYRSQQAFLIRRFLRPVFNRWLTLNLGVSPDVQIAPSRLNKFLSGALFVPRGWAWVDPSKEVKAAIEGIEAGLNSRKNVTTGNGLDFDEVVEDLGEEQAMLNEAGLDGTDETS